MKIDCILRTWFKEKHESKFSEVPVYDIHYYKNREEFEVNYSLQIIALREENEPHILAERTFIPDGKTTHYIRFLDFVYMYDEGRDMIYTTQTQREI